jgi:hypothetical protein
MSSSACLSNDHSPSKGSPPSELLFSRFDAASSPNSATGSPGFAVTSPVSQFESPTGLNLVVDLFSFPLQQHTSSSLPAFSFVVC